MLLGDHTAFAVVNRARGVGEVDHSASWERRVWCEDEREQVLIETHDLDICGWQRVNERVLSSSMESRRRCERHGLSLRKSQSRESNLGQWLIRLVTRCPVLG